MIKKLKKDYIKIIKETIVNELKDEDVSIALFGSFASGCDNYSSDVDIAVIPKGRKNLRLAGLREKLEELKIPYKVDIVDFTYVSDSFKETALKNAIWWKV